jgi:putative transposase
MNGHKIVNQNHIHFITPTIVGWVDVFSRKIYKDIIIDSLKYCQENKGLIVYSYVIMSNHLHLVISAKEGFQLSNIIRDFMKFTSKRIIAEVLSNPKESRQEWMLRLFKYFAKYNKNNTTYQLWKRDNHPVELVRMDWMYQKINDTHQNPVRAGIVLEAIDYYYSSARNYEGLKLALEVKLLIDFDF